MGICGQNAWVARRLSMMHTFQKTHSSKCFQACGKPCDPSIMERSSLAWVKGGGRVSQELSWNIMKWCVEREA